MSKLVNCTKMLQKARREGYAVGQFNINNMDWAKAILEVCEEMQSPVILGVSAGASKYIGGVNTVKMGIEGMMIDLNITVPVSIHLDHGKYDFAIECMNAGWPSVMFDGSSMGIEENIEKTKEILAIAKTKGISVEAEVGAIAGEEDGVTGDGEIACPKECVRLAETGVDLLAAGIGNIHGKYPENWSGLSFNVLEEINEKTNDVPLVLHGGSGISDDLIKKSISLGVAKINVNSEKQWEFAKSVRKYFEAEKDLEAKGFDPRKVIGSGIVAVKEVVRQKIELFGSKNKA